MRHGVRSFFFRLEIWPETRLMRFVKFSISTVLLLHLVHTGVFHQMVHFFVKDCEHLQHWQSIWFPSGLPPALWAISPWNGCRTARPSPRRCGPTRPTVPPSAGPCPSCWRSSTARCRPPSSPPSPAKVCPSLDDGCLFGRRRTSNPKR